VLQHFPISSARASVNELGSPRLEMPMPASLAVRLLLSRRLGRMILCLPSLRLGPSRLMPHSRSVFSVGTP